MNAMTPEGNGGYYTLRLSKQAAEFKNNSALPKQNGPAAIATEPVLCAAYCLLLTAYSPIPTSRNSTMVSGGLNYRARDGSGCLAPGPAAGISR